MRILLFSALAISLMGCQNRSAPASNESGTAPAASTAQVDRSHSGQPAPSLAFNTPDAQPTSLRAFAGKPTLVNLWATWCAPCVKELPTLDALARSRGEGLNVVAINQDMAPHASVEAFFQAHRITGLKSYQDPKMSLSGALGAEVLPTSILYDSDGREVWRYVGDLDWTSSAAARLLGEAGAATGS